MSQARITVSGIPLAEAVLRRVAGAMAAQVDLPIDRVSDTILAVEAAVASVADAVVTSIVSLGGDSIEVRIGPMGDDVARDFDATELPALGAVLRGLTDRAWLDQSDVCITVGGANSPSSGPNAG